MVEHTSHDDFVADCCLSGRLARWRGPIEKLANSLRWALGSWKLQNIRAPQLQSSQKLVAPRFEKGKLLKRSEF
jgi:hypothetical protein